MFAPSPRLQSAKFPFFIILGAIALIAIIVGGQKFLASRSAPAEQRSAAPRAQGAVVRTAPVTTGVIRSVFSYAGSVQATDQVNLVPKTSGIIQTIPVDVGTRVRAGQVLATLDPGTLTDQLTQAQAGLDQAQAKYQQILAQGRPEDVAAATALLQQAQAKLDSMLLQGRAEDVQAAQQVLAAAQAKLDQMVQGGRPEAIAQAQAAVDSANAKLTTVLKGPTDDIRAAAQNAVNADQAAVASAQLALTNVNSTSGADVQAAQAQVNADQATMLVAQDALNNLPYTFPSDLRAAQQSYDATVMALSTAQMNYETAKNQVPTSSQTAINDAQTKVAQAQAQYDAAQSTMTGLSFFIIQTPVSSTGGSGSGSTSSGGSSSSSTSVCLRDPNTHNAVNPAACNAAIQAATSNLAATQSALTTAQNNLAALRQGPTPAQIQAQLSPLRQAYETADANAASARSKLDNLATYGMPMRDAELRSTLTSAQQKLAADQAKLDALIASGVSAQQSSFQSLLTAAQERLKSDQAKLDEVLSQPKQEDIDQAQATVVQANQALALAIRPSSDEDIRSQQAVVDQARANLQKAMQPFTAEDIRGQQQVVAQQQAALQTKIRPFTSDDIRVAQIAVDAARAQVGVARANLDQMVLTAPFEGVVGARLLAVGGFAAPQTPILTLSGHGLEVHITVEEARVSAVSPGQLVRLMVPAYPDTQFTGHVATVATVGDPRAHTFDVTIYPDQQDARLMAGMYAQVQVTAAEKENAVLVPREAVVQQTDGSTVFVVENNKAVARKVQLGISDDTSQEILSGVTAGEPVIVQGQNSVKNDQAVTVPGANPGGGTGGQPSGERTGGERPAGNRTP